MPRHHKKQRKHTKRGGNLNMMQQPVGNEQSVVEEMAGHASQLLDVANKAASAAATAVISHPAVSGAINAITGHPDVEKAKAAIHGLTAPTPVVVPTYTPGSLPTPQQITTSAPVNPNLVPVPPTSMQGGKKHTRKHTRKHKKHTRKHKGGKRHTRKHKRTSHKHKKRANK